MRKKSINLPYSQKPCTISQLSLSPLYQGDASFEDELTNRNPRLRNMVDNPHLPYFLDGSRPISYPVTSIAINQCPKGYMASKFRDPLPAQNEAN